MFAFPRDYVHDPETIPTGLVEMVGKFPLHSVKVSFMRKFATWSQFQTAPFGLTPKFIVIFTHIRAKFNNFANSINAEMDAQQFHA